MKEPEPCQTDPNARRRIGTGIADLQRRRASRRGGLRVPGQRERGAVPPAHQHLQRRRGRAGTRRLWFDPTADFHTYSILWNPHNIILSIDGAPIRVFRDNAARGVPFPARQPAHVFASIWDAEEWATQGGRVKTDWASAPFVAAYRRYNVSSATACVWDERDGRARCPAAAGGRRRGWRRGWTGGAG